MIDSDRFENPLVERYASEEMTRLFSPRERIRTWRRIWIALAEAQAELAMGGVTPEQVDALRGAADAIDFERAAQLERELRHDVMAHVHAFGEKAPTAAGILHLGATSAFVVDNGDLLLQRRAMRVVERKALGVVAALADFAEVWADTPALAWTHFQPAQPTTVGKRACLWIQDLLLDLDEIAFRLDAFRLRGAKGTTGTQASFLALAHGDHERVEEMERRVVDKLGAPDAFAVTGQTYSRKVDAAWAATLSGVAQSAGKFGNDLRLLQHLGEVLEPFGSSQVGSSAMPYKRNPMRSERMCSIARLAIQTAGVFGWTAAKLDAISTQCLHYVLAQHWVGALEHQGKSIIAASLSGEMGLVLLGIQVFKKHFKILRSQFVVVVKPLELRTTDNGVDFRAAHVVRREGKNEIRV